MVHLTQGLRDDFAGTPLATSTPADIQEARLSPQSLKASLPPWNRNPILTVPSLSLPQYLSLCWSRVRPHWPAPSPKTWRVLACWTKRGEDSSCEREWLHGSKKNNYQSVERHSKTTGHKGHQLWIRLTGKMCLPATGRPLSFKHTRIPQHRANTQKL